MNLCIMAIRRSPCGPTRHEASGQTGVKSKQDFASGLTPAVLEVAELKGFVKADQIGCELQAVALIADWAKLWPRCLEIVGWAASGLWWVVAHGPGGDALVP